MDGYIYACIFIILMPYIQADIFILRNLSERLSHKSKCETMVAFTTTFEEMNFTGSILWKLEP